MTVFLLPGLLCDETIWSRPAQGSGRVRRRCHSGFPACEFDIRDGATGARCSAGAVLSCRALDGRARGAGGFPDGAGTGGAAGAARYRRASTRGGMRNRNAGNWSSWPAARGWLRWPRAGSRRCYIRITRRCLKPLTEWSCARRPRPLRISRGHCSTGPMRGTVLPLHSMPDAGALRQAGHLEPGLAARGDCGVDSASEVGDRGGLRSHVARRTARVT